MTRALTFLAAAFLAAPTLARGQDAVPSAPREFEVAGIPVIYKPVEGNQVIAVQLYLRGGSPNLTPETAGIERLIGAAMTRGTEAYDKDAFASRAASTGTLIGATALYDYTVFSMQAVGEDWDAAWDLFTQAVLHPTFPEDEVALVRQQAVNQLKAVEDDPDAYLARLANEELYAGHPYAQPPEGTVESVEGIEREDLARWRARRMTKENLVFVVVGNVSRDDLARKVEVAFGDLPATGGAAVQAPGLEPREPDVQVVERELPTNYVRGEFAAPAIGDPDYAPLRVAVDVLSDRFFEEVRTKRNLTYAVFAGLSQRSANYGLVYVTAVQPDSALQVMQHEMRRLATEPLDAQRLAEQVNVFLTQYWLGQESNMGQAAMLGTFEMTGGGWKNAEAFVERVRRVTPADVKRVAAEYLKDLRFVVLGDPDSVDRAVFTSL